VVVCGAASPGNDFVLATLHRLVRKLHDPIVCVRPVDPIAKSVWRWCMTRGHTLKIFHAEADDEFAAYVLERTPAFCVEFSGRKRDPLGVKLAAAGVRHRKVEK